MGNDQCSGDVEVTFQYYHGGYAGQMLAISEANHAASASCLDTDDTDYLAFLRIHPDRYEHSGSPYMNRWTHSDQGAGLQVQFYAAVDGGFTGAVRHTLAEFCSR